MLKDILNVGKSLIGLPNLAISTLSGLGLKPIQHFIDSHFRPTVSPVAGSVVYADLYYLVEHSGIYVGDNQISNIVVDSLATFDATVRLSDPADFTQKSQLSKKIYVSCRGDRAVGDDDVGDYAYSQVGEKSFYGIVFSNCHTFSTKCVLQSKRQAGFGGLIDTVIPVVATVFGVSAVATMPKNEPNLAHLKQTAKIKLGADKWLLWDYDNTAKNTPEPDWDDINQVLEQTPLTPAFREQLRQVLAELGDYQNELADEPLPSKIREKLATYGTTLQKVADAYDDNAEFLAMVGGGFSYEQLELFSQQTDFRHLVNQIKNNRAIMDLIKKMGKNYISEDKKRQIKIPKSSQDEVYGTHNSDDLARLLPSELVNIDDDDLEYLFYAKLLEKNLTTYQLSGINYDLQDEHYNADKAITGPIVVCLDTSGSMSGEPLLKAKALLFATANILKDENRHLYVMLFGASGQLKELKITDNSQSADLLAFLNNGFNGGTDFETPLNRAVEIIEQYDEYKKADILMISDGDCQLSDEFAHSFKHKTEQADCRVYSVLCRGERVADNFSDEIVVL